VVVQLPSTATLISVFLGNGDGSFLPALTFAAPIATNSLVLTDLNGDGIPDITTTGSSGLAVLKGNGDGTFGSPQFPLIGAFFHIQIVADIDGDGRPDVLVMSYSSNLTIIPGAGQTSTSPLYDVGVIPNVSTVTGTSSADQITLLRDADGPYIDWLTSSAAGRVAINDPAGLTINGNGSNDVLTLNPTFALW